jgi:hypothetical protein
MMPAGSGPQPGAFRAALSLTLSRPFLLAHLLSLHGFMLSTIKLKGNNNYEYHA